MQNLLKGTLPVRPYHPTQLFGTIQADGQMPKVAALACHKQELVVLSLVGYDTSVSAAFARLWQGEQLAFEPNEEAGTGTGWQGPLRFGRRAESYRQFHASLPGTKEVHDLALPVSANIAEGILHPPDIPRPKPEQPPARSNPTLTLPQVEQARFVLGNWDEDTPHGRSFLGQLHAMRVIFLHRHRQPALVQTWAEQLWLQGLARDLISPLPALGIKAWKLSGDLAAWGTLVSEGVRSGCLPWQTEPEQQEVDMP